MVNILRNAAKLSLQSSSRCLAFLSLLEKECVIPIMNEKTESLATDIKQSRNQLPMRTLNDLH